MKVQVPKDIYKLVFENLLSGLAYCQMIFDSEGRPSDFLYIKVNKNFEKLTGLKNAEGKKVSELIPGIRTSNPELIETYGRVALGAGAERFEINIKQLAEWFLISAFSPKKKFFVALFQNITEQKEVELNLRDSRLAALNVLDDLNIEKMSAEMASAKEEAILSSIGDGLIVVDEKENIIFINNKSEKLLGWKNEEVIGKVFSEVVPVESEKGLPILTNQRPIKKALINDTTIITTAGPTYYYIRKDKTKFPVAITVTPIIQNGKVIGAVDIFRDITNEKQIDRAKTEFVSLASHQLRTPLTSIGWYTEMMLNGDVGAVTVSQKKYLEEIYQGNRRLIDLVNTLLDVSRIELGTFKFESKQTDVIAIARSVLDEEKLEIAGKLLTVTENFSMNVPAFPTDPKLIRMIFQNLLNNAIKYTPRGGNITFAISIDTGKNILIKISDSGYGIPENQQDKIFTKLFRADNAREVDPNGTGLGLYIIKSIVKNFGGKIWFESQAYKGTTFYVELPTEGPRKVSPQVFAQQ
jgi:PAS domain S-box-containing protein